MCGSPVMGRDGPGEKSGGDLRGGIGRIAQRIAQHRGGFGHFAQRGVAIRHGVDGLGGDDIGMGAEFGFDGCEDFGGVACHDAILS